MDAGVAEIKREHFDVLKSSHAVMVVKTVYGYQVWQWSPDGVAPASDYDISQEAAARACQLLGLSDPVVPQNWPEIAQIGGPPAPPPKPF